jgi:hypothetical protein
MRRLLAVLLLLPALAVPAGAQPPGPRAVYHEPGRLALGPVPGERRLHAALEEAATGPLARRVLRAYDVAVAEARLSPSGYRIREVFALGDLDGDKVGDLLHYDARFQFSRGTPKGDVTLAVNSGRTGARRWRKTLKGLAIAYPFEVKVGSGKAGLLLLRPYDADGDLDEDAFRVVGLGGARGETVYDRTVSDRDGLGDVQWGGLLNAVPGGGTEVLVGRLKSQAVLVKDWLRAETSTPYVLDGKDGKLTAVGTGTPAVSSLTGFLAVGDLNSDGRDDFVGVRRLEGETGTITAFSSTDGTPLWTSPPVTIGYGLRVAGLADMAGDKRRDLLIETWISPYGLLEIKDVTDGVPVVDQQATVHAYLFDALGLLQWDRDDGPATYLPIGDVDKDGKADVLSAAIISDLRVGLRFTAVTAANKVLYSREVTVQAARGEHIAVAEVAPQGDIDGDRVTDVAYTIYTASRYGLEFDVGFFLGRNAVVRELGTPLGGTVDGRGDDFVTGGYDPRGVVVTVRDGVLGRPYWTAGVSVAGGASWGVGAIRGARGKCAGVVLIGRNERGMWLTALDGGTGRARWTRAVEGRAPRVTVRASGTPARCR